MSEPVSYIPTQQELEREIDNLIFFKKNECLEHNFKLLSEYILKKGNAHARIGILDLKLPFWHWKNIRRNYFCKYNRLYNHRMAIYFFDLYDLILLLKEGHSFYNFKNSGVQSRFVEVHGLRSYFTEIRNLIKKIAPEINFALFHKKLGR